MNNKEGNERKKQIHLERNFVNVKQYALIHKTSHTSQKKTLSHQALAEPKNDKLLEVWLLI